MASISFDRRTDRRTLQFVGNDGRRQSIRLGHVSKRQAEAVKVRIEDLVAARAVGHVPGELTLFWLTKIGDSLHAKLAALGLIDLRPRLTLASFLDDYVARRVDVKRSTKLVYGHTKRNLISYFGPSTDLRDITPGRADHWRLQLGSTEGLRPNTVRRRCGIAKQFFRAAQRLNLIPSNPFAEIKGSVLAVPERLFFVTREMTQKVITACPNAEWRLIVALIRFGGLRCPSELLALHWNDIDWKGKRICVRSPKTEHHAGGQSRLIPIFPELETHLREVHEASGQGAEFVITRYRQDNANLRTQLRRILRRAGLTPWPKLFQNLRSTRETELAESWPLHVVCAWMGNSQRIAARHYLQVTEEHFDQAATSPIPST